MYVVPTFCIVNPQTYNVDSNVRGVVEGAVNGGRALPWTCNE